MENFPVSPEVCLIVRAFGRTRSLREASKLLRCDPSALVRKAQKIESEHGLMRKIRGRWTLTDSGQIVAQWVERSIVMQKSMLGAKSRIRIATTTWLAEEVLIPSISLFQSSMKADRAWELRTSGKDPEGDLLNASVEYVITCQPPQDPAIAHKRVVPERWIVVIPAEWQKETKRAAEK